MNFVITLYPSLTEENIQYIVDALKKVIYMQSVPEHEIREGWIMPLSRCPRCKKLFSKHENAKYAACESCQEKEQTIMTEFEKY
jgi:hypothetical protein